VVAARVLRRLPSPTSPRAQIRGSQLVLGEHALSAANVLAEFFRWFCSVVSVCVRVHPRLTVGLILALTGSNVAQVVAFFLPLKVLVLSGSESVPSYFRYFIAPEFSMLWIAGLSAGAVLAYAISVALERIAGRWSEVGSRDLLLQSSCISIRGNQGELADTTVSVKSWHYRLIFTRGMKIDAEAAGF
jgi:hypothetical protein